MAIKSKHMEAWYSLYSWYYSWFKVKEEIKEMTNKVEGFFLIPEYTYPGGDFNITAEMKMDYNELGYITVR